MVNDGLVGDYFDHSSLEEIKCPNLGDVVHECLFDLGLNDYRLIEPRFIDLGPREYFQIIPLELESRRGKNIPLYDLEDVVDEIIFQYKRQGLDASLALDIQEDGSYFIETHRPMNGYGFSFVESVSLEFIEPKIIWVDD